MNIKPCWTQPVEIRVLPMQQLVAPWTSGLACAFRKMHQRKEKKFFNHWEQRSSTLQSLKEPTVHSKLPENSQKNIRKNIFTQISIAMKTTGKHTTSPPPKKYSLTFPCSLILFADSELPEAL